ncbi:MAG: hypothetical protein KBT02_05815 [Treponema sp.]|nr:hypothetical protein [Candidatus Treponema caballi]
MGPVNNTQKEFFDDFEKRTGLRPESLELASLEASPSTLSQLELQYPIGQTQLWGLFVFCEKHLFFFSHAADYTICGFKPSDGFESQKEQMLDFARFKNVRAQVRSGKNFFTRLFGPVNQLDLVLTLEDGKQISCLLKTTGKAALVAEKINSCF